MGETSYSAIQRTLNDADLSALPKLEISVLRNVTVEALEPYLRYLAYEQGIDARLRFGEFDNVVQEALAPDESLLGDGTGAVLIFLQLETLSPQLGGRFAELDRPAVEAEAERVRGLISTVLRSIRKHTAAMILWHGFETPLHPALGIVDANRAGGQIDTLAELNRHARAELAAAGNAYFVDLDACRGRVGEDGFYDLRYWHIGRAPYAREGLRAIAEEDFKFVRALRGLNKKCLVLDCDNVLWGGVIGEDGMTGIKLAETHPGSPYHELQQQLVQLYHRGVILALNSKNNEEDVWQVFDEHPGMLLRREHIAAWRINWQDKATNLRELAAELNIGLQHMVFADDSEFEVNLVREMLPEVHVLHLPPAAVVRHRHTLASCGLFDTLTLSDEDRKRGAMYRAEAQRKQLRTEVTDLDGYYRSLRMRLRIALADDLSIPRIAQLTQKTNQFNMTTRRYSEEDIRRFAGADDADVLRLHLTDRFGDSGLVGVCILRYEEQAARFDTLLMSCRVLGRRVEDAFLAHCLRRARVRGCTRAVGLYAPTAKNRLARNFFAERGFRPAGETDGVQEFAYDLQQEPPEEPAVFENVDSEVGEPSVTQREENR